MTRKWNDKQTLEKQKDSRVLNFLADKSKDFSIISEDDKCKTYHV
jgi:hypothetical protein